MFCSCFDVLYTCYKLIFHQEQHHENTDIELLGDYWFDDKATMQADAPDQRKWRNFIKYVV